MLHEMIQGNSEELKKTGLFNPTSAPLWNVVVVQKVSKNGLSNVTPCDIIVLEIEDSSSLLEKMKDHYAVQNLKNLH